MQEITIIDKARRILENPVCDNCLGRQFAKLLSGYTNHERGRILRTLVAMSMDKEKPEHDDKKIDISNLAGYKFHNLEVQSIAEKKCSYCNDVFKNLDKIAGKLVKKMKALEITTFLVGTKISSELNEKEEKLWEAAGIDFCEPIKAELNREIGKLIEKHFGLKFNSKRPDATFLFSIPSGSVSVQVNPLFIYGEYQKLVRGIPQTRWPSGKYKTSVEQIVAKPFMSASSGKAHKFHGCIGGNAKILLNECSLPIESLENNWKKHEVLTYDEKKKEIVTSGIKDFIKIELETYKVRTKETGREIIVSKEHPFFTPNGMIALSNLKSGNTVAINPVEPLQYEYKKEKIIIDKNQVFEIIEKYVPTSYKKKIMKELEERKLLPLKTNDNNTLILARIIAFLFGDGNVRYTRKRDVGIEFYGSVHDLKQIRNDLKDIGFKSFLYKKKGSHSTIRDYFGREKIIESKNHQTVLICYSKSLWVLLVSLGVPIGNKVINNFEIPRWVKESMLYKREFLASLFGCEMDMPRLDKRKYNRKSFNTPRFSMNKIENNLGSMILFMNDIRKILSEFEIKTLKTRVIPCTTRKDGHKSVKVILDFNNSFENLINLYSRINFRYCKDKESLSKHVLYYLSMKKNAVDLRRNLFKKALELKNSGLKLSEIHRKLDNKAVDKKDLWLWIHNKISPENIKVQNKFPDFDEWLENSAKGLSDGLLWETIELIEKNGYETVYDITVPKNHNFFANGFLVSNSGREDIDARCFGWRPFVLEIIAPKKRKFDPKKYAKMIVKKIKVRNIRFSNINEVRELKESRPDKTYRTLVACKNALSSRDLAKLKCLEGATIRQRTPMRVMHRRADRLRKRVVKEIKTVYIGKNSFRLIVRGDAGLYIKELISGDSGRTNPSVSLILDNPCECKEIDVMKIHQKRG
ncbi:MAG: hypothetical protein HZB67_04205 [Candidatus Aenigmarchaeota archaeon]|nr:hypothetical protein [Candidatus Aenigmarchaeota archaeon]